MRPRYQFSHKEIAGAHSDIVDWLSTPQTNAIVTYISALI